MLYNWYNHLSQEGKKYGYLVNGSKSWLIVKSEVLGDEAKRVFGDEVNITTEGKRLLGAVIGSHKFKGQYSPDHFQTVKKMLAPNLAQKMLCIIVPLHPLLDLLNSSYPTHPDSLIAKYAPVRLTKQVCLL